MGNMGHRLGEEFGKDGYDVQLTGEDPLKEIGPTKPKDWKRAIRRWNENICKNADVVVFSVPIPLLSGNNGLSDIFGHNPPRGWRDKLVLDICSTKVGPIKALTELKGASVVGTHPMFGPKIKSLVGQTVFICPVTPPDGNHVLQARLDMRLKWLKSFWERRGVEIVEITAKEHDAFMPAVQFGVLLSVLLYGEGLKANGVSLDDVQRRGTPNSKAICARLARMISPAMLSTYVNIIFDNPQNLKWLESTAASLTRLQKWMTNGNRDAVLAWMQELAGFQSKAFQTHFTDTSIFVDECVAKRAFVKDCLAKEADIRAFLASRESSK